MNSKKIKKEIIDSLSYKVYQTGESNQTSFWSDLPGYCQNFEDNYEKTFDNIIYCILKFKEDALKFISDYGICCGVNKLLNIITLIKFEELNEDYI